jgi:hypothetical protein
MQPSTFLSRTEVNRLGGDRNHLHYALDWELYLRFLADLRSNIRIATIDTPLSVARLHKEAKTVRQWQDFVDEGEKVLEDIADRLTVFERLYAGLYRRKVRINREAEKILSSDSVKNRLNNLLSLLFKNPAAVMSRFYWGALKKAFLERWNKNHNPI